MFPYSNGDLNAPLAMVWFRLLRHTPSNVALTRIAEVKEAEMCSKQNWRNGILLISRALFALMLLESTFSF